MPCTAEIPVSRASQGSCQTWVAITPARGTVCRAWVITVYATCRKPIQVGVSRVYRTTITKYFDTRVESFPERIAIYDGERGVTFKDLQTMALNLAVEIKDRLSSAAGKVIGVCLPKSIEAIVADLAILYSGNAYMNLDIKSPWARTARILETIEPDLIICDATPAEAVDLPLLHISCSLVRHAEYTEVLKLRDSRIDADLACVINTSGSTGTPKGVALTHRGFLDYVASVSAEGLVDDGEVVASLAPIIFDHFSFEVCLLAMKGCTLLLIPDQFAAFPLRMLELMAARKATFLFWVPTIMVNIANMDLLSAIRLPDLKKIWFAGEVFPTAKFNYWKKHFPDAVFVNLYGPTEITVDCLFYRADRTLADEEPIPVGRPLPNTAILLLDENDSLIGPESPDVQGELCVRGSCVAMGYYNNPEKTQQAFTKNPLNSHYPEYIYRTGDIMVWNKNGELVFKGRRDGMIKHSGYRIELGEIEHTAINVLKLFDNCCAVYDPGHKKIILIYEGAHELAEKELRRKISAAVPKYMVPSVFVHIPELPRNANGKIDRLKLAQQMIQSA